MLLSQGYYIAWPARRTKPTRIGGWGRRTTWGCKLWRSWNLRRFWEVSEERLRNYWNIAKVELRELEERKGKKGKKRKGGDDQDTEEGMVSYWSPAIDLWSCIWNVSGSVRSAGRKEREGSGREEGKEAKVWGQEEEKVLTFQSLSLFCISPKFSDLDLYYGGADFQQAWPAWRGELIRHYKLCFCSIKMLSRSKISNLIGI